MEVLMSSLSAEEIRALVEAVRKETLKPNVMVSGIKGVEVPDVHFNGIRLANVPAGQEEIINVGGKAAFNSQPHEEELPLFD